MIAGGVARGAVERIAEGDSKKRGRRSNERSSGRDGRKDSRRR